MYSVFIYDDVFASAEYVQQSSLLIKRNVFIVLIIKRLAFIIFSTGVYGVRKYF